MKELHLGWWCNNFDWKLTRQGYRPILCSQSVHSKNVVEKENISVFCVVKVIAELFVLHLTLELAFSGLLVGVLP